MAISLWYKSMSKKQPVIPFAWGKQVPQTDETSPSE